jgi:hypothetical protein
VAVSERERLGLGKTEAIANIFTLLEENGVRILVIMAINTVTKNKLKPSPSSGMLATQRRRGNAERMAIQDHPFLRGEARVNHKGGQVFVTVFSSSASEDDPPGGSGIG